MSLCNSVNNGHRTTLQAQPNNTDEMGMYISPIGVSGLMLIVALIMFTLYIMRRRSRQGLRTPKF